VQSEARSPVMSCRTCSIRACVRRATLGGWSGTGSCRTRAGSRCARRGALGAVVEGSSGRKKGTRPWRARCPPYELEALLETSRPPIRERGAGAVIYLLLLRQRASTFPLCGSPLALRGRCAASTSGSITVGTLCRRLLLAGSSVGTIRGRSRRIHRAAWPVGLTWRRSPPVAVERARSMVREGRNLPSRIVRAFRKLFRPPARSGFSPSTTPRATRHDSRVVGHEAEEERGLDCEPFCQ